MSSSKCEILGWARQPELDPEPVVVEPDTADPDVVFVVAVDVDVTTVPDVAS